MKVKLRRRKKKVEYTDGPEGFIKWVEENVRGLIHPVGEVVPKWVLIGELPDTLHPLTGKSWKGMWEEQKKVVREALKMEDGRFYYRLIVFCWMRGEGKSFLTVLIKLWKFFCFQRQRIMLGANSKDQIKFVHFDEMRSIILNSPKLLKYVGGKRNLQEKEIRLKDERGAVVSLIRSISSFTGIVSNITGYTFSEIFDMKNPKFFVQLDGSIRTIPDAMGVIDSTVSEKTHILYNLWSGVTGGKTKRVFFSYRYSKTGDVADYWNPNMDEEQLSDYQAKFPFGEFERYFLNLWSAGTLSIFSDEMIEEIGCLGCDGELLNHTAIKSCIKRKIHIKDVMIEMGKKSFFSGEDMEESASKITVIDSRINVVDNYYTLKNPYGGANKASIEQLNSLSEILDTNFVIIAGTDFGDPYAIRSTARTIFTVLAKCLPGSRTNSHLTLVLEASQKYLYFLLQLIAVDSHSLDTIKDNLDQANDEYEGVDMLCSERYGAWDVGSWCEERDIKFEPIYPNYDRQREAFKELLLTVREGRFKAPMIGVPGSKKEDIFREELSVFMHDSDKRLFCSPEKYEKHGIQDDVVYAVTWAMYGGRFLGVDDFRIRKGIYSLGELYKGEKKLAKY